MHWCYLSVLPSIESPSLLLDSEQEVPPGTTESVQSVDYYCDSKLKYNLAIYMKALVVYFCSLTLFSWQCLLQFSP